MPAPKHPRARLTEAFLAKVRSTGLTDAATARAIGVTPQYYSAVKAGIEQPSVGFMAGAVKAGLANSFDGVAEVAEPHKAAA